MWNSDELTQVDIIVNFIKSYDVNGNSLISEARLFMRLIFIQSSIYFVCNDFRKMFANNIEQADGATSFGLSFLEEDCDGFISVL